MIQESETEVQTHDPSTQGVEAGGSEAHGHLWPHSEFQASEDDRRLSHIPPTPKK